MLTIEIILLICISTLIHGQGINLNNLSKLKFEETTNLFPETDFKTYERSKFQARSLDSDKVYDLKNFDFSKLKRRNSHNDPNLEELKLDEEYESKLTVKRSGLNVTEIARQFMSQNYPGIDYVFTNVYDFDDARSSSVHMAQAINGVEILNTAININIDKTTGNIISSGVSIWKDVKPILSIDENNSLDLKDAIAIANKDLELIKDPIDLEALNIENFINGRLRVTGVPFTHDGRLIARKLYTGVSSTEADEIWELTGEIGIEFYVICVSITKKTVIQVQNLTNHAIYRVVPLNMPNIGNSARVSFKDPYFKKYSRLGWHNDNYHSYHDTRGNNVHVVENSDGDDDISQNKYIDGGEELRFEFAYAENKERIEDNQGAAATNVFYLTNLLHDLFYKLGFTEGYGNFQRTNFSGEGKDNDPVIVIINDRSGKNNAQMSTGIDGISPKLRLYPFDIIPGQPERDPAFDNEIITHEYTHGVTQRLTGGASNVKCLIEEESKALNEGWSDFFANAFQYRRDRDRYDPLYLFRYVLDEEHGRKYPITSDTTLNPLMYSDLSHDSGKALDTYIGAEIWSVTLHEIFWNVVKNFKSNPEFFVSTSKSTFKPSNAMVMEIIIDGMKNQPCNPNFISARDSILNSLNNFKQTNEKLTCFFWIGFALRGLGYYAKGPVVRNGRVIYRNDQSVPDVCMNYINLI